MERLLGKCCIAIAIVLLVGISIAHFSIIIPLVSSSLTTAIFHAFMGLVLIFNIFYNFGLCMHIGPGKVAEWKHLYESGESQTFCKSCNDYRPDRAHHCSVCDSCILKMDHHCPWLDTCVGQHNHKYFILFLFWLVSGSCYVVYLVTNVYWYHYSRVKGSNIMPFVLYTTASAALALGGFLMWHLYLIVTAQTSIEIQMAQKYKGSMVSSKSVYDRGIRKNIDLVFKQISRIPRQTNKIKESQSI